MENRENFYLLEHENTGGELRGRVYSDLHKTFSPSSKEVARRWLSNLTPDVKVLSVMPSSVEPN